ncbi:hypothetical protein IWW34DRAFT_810791 [Fusarium oxysporum f. sp. albedinis]|nr:hypothetical protein IWW34DRAFT_810791 [Fusarium oxysporum f. sp. albedinis]
MPLWRLLGEPLSVSTELATTWPEVDMLDENGKTVELGVKNADGYNNIPGWKNYISTSIYQNPRLSVRVVATPSLWMATALGVIWEKSIKFLSISIEKLIPYCL